MPESALQIQFRNQTIAGFAQRETLLRKRVMTEFTSKGGQYVFQVVNPIGRAVTRGVNGNIPYQPLDTSQFTATIREAHGTVERTGYNMFQSQGTDQNAAMQDEAIRQINVDIDDVIITELNTGTVTSGVTGAATLNWLTAGRGLLMRADVPDAEITAIITPDAEKQLLRQSVFTSQDFVDRKVLVGTREKSIDGHYRFMNMTIIVSNRLPGATTSAATCIMFHREAIGHAANTQTMDVQSDYERKQDSSWVRATLYHGSRLLQNAGVVKMTHDDTAA